MKFIKYILIFFTAFQLNAESSDQRYYDIYSAFDTYGRAFHQLNNFYVSDIEPKKLLKNSIEGMVSSLDPYTFYIEEDDSDGVDYLTSGYYVGFGVSVKKLDNNFIVSGIIEGYSADESGMRTGDIILEIDSVQISNISEDSVRSLLKGEIETTSKVKYTRPGTSDTISVELERKEVMVEDVPYFSLLNDTTAYVKLDQFSVKADYTFRKALRELENSSKFTSLIIDLRDNPGGLLAPALKITELFLPTNTLILTTRGRHKESVNEYKTESSAKYPDVKLAVLINENSASSSEIIAGAIQDTDRGVVIGRKSFGKGLVQQVMDFPDGSKLKITTAKYYTPSGRCIQKNDHNIDRNQYDMNSNMLFRTKNGRKVNKEDGISPDKRVEKDDHPQLVDDLISNYYIFNFASEYASKFENDEESASYKTEDFDQFLDYMSNGKRYYDLKLLKSLNNIHGNGYKKLISDESSQNMTLLEASLKDDIRNSLIENEELITDLIDDWVKKIVLNRSKAEINQLESDKFVKEALQTLKGDYFNVLQASAEKTEVSE